MAYQTLSLTDGGANTIDLNTAPVRQALYAPNTGDGSEAQEDLHLVLEGTLNDLESWLYQAQGVLEAGERHLSDGLGLPLYLRLRYRSGDPMWQSPLLSATLRAEPPQPESGRLAGSLTRQRGTMRLTITLRRADYWEAVEAINLLSAETVHNGCWSASGYSNSLTIPQASISGALPAPLSLEVTNTGAADLGDLWVGCEARFGGGMENQLEAEDMGALGPGVSVTADPACSQDASLTYSGSSGAETQIGAYPMSAALLTAARNRAYRLLGLFKGTSAEHYAYLRLEHSGVTLAQSSTVRLSDGVVDFGVFQLPPWFYDAASPYDPAQVDLVLSTYQANGTPTLQVDAFKALPVDDGFLYFQNLGLGLAPGHTLHQAGLRCYSYSLSGIGGMYFITHRLRGTLLQVVPGSEARLHFVWARRSGGFDARDTLSISASYRPRCRIP